MNKSFQHLFQLGLAILVMSSSGTLGSYITLTPAVTILIRCVIGAFALWAVLKFLKLPTFIGWGRDFNLVLISSIFLAAHWVTYFYSLTLSGVAVGMLSLFTYPVVTSLLEPFFMKTKFKLWDVTIAMIALSGVFFLIPEFDLNNNITLGTTIGISSAIFYAIRNILMKKNLSGHSGITMMYYQLLIISLLLLPVLFFIDFNQTISIISSEWHALLILGLLTTAIGHTMFVISFKNFSITTVSIISNLTPLCGIVLGYFILDEAPHERALIGGAIIMISVIAESLRTLKKV
ncbi:MAG: drug/metabolite transporter (DMT)-like permease [Cyclobacteriaceae bacterium]|jgi:drug/metabolite transporter (DMT)-like permease